MATEDAKGPEKEKLLPRLRRKYAWLDHLVRANDAFTERYGNHYAAAITYFSVLSLFPLMMVGFSITAMVLRGNTVVLDQIRDGITSSAPAGLSDFLNSIVNAALSAGAGTGILGLVLALYSGIGWMTNLRDALTAQWGQEKQQLPLVSTTLKDLLRLAGLGLALAISFGLAAAGSGIGQLLLELVGLEHESWAVFLLRLATIVLGLLANTLVFLWVIARLPREKVSARSAIKGAIMAAIGFEVLKQVTTVYLGFVTNSPSTVLFGPILGLLFFANLVSRFLLFVTAWTATAKENMVTVVEPPPPAIIRPRIAVERPRFPFSATAGAFSAGALLGWFGRRRR
ncbi:inner membrane protein YhjD [Amycolatopsis sp.]|uniref:inner membrane protein YhjD n=1 Tax=Amycolatopsis sp. TaxID=37632 RepID=UPI002E0039B6|nr:inner membrane protein YhjD [Amycolatopsis sp.]